MDAPFYQRTWIDIDLDALKANYRTAKSLTKATVTCVIKSNAYGHGAVRVAQALAEEGCRSFAVSCAREGLELRKSGLQGEILVMGLTEKPMLPVSIRNELTLTIGDLQGLRDAEEAAAALQTVAHAHLAADTGFHRLGFDVTEAAADAVGAEVKQLHWLHVEGLYSHLGLITPERDQMQYDNLMRMWDMLHQRGVNFTDVHLCDSIGLVRYPQWHMSRVRVGALLFGVRPYHSEHMPFEDKETLTFNTTISQVRDVAAGEVVGYSDDQVLDHDARIATLCAGYGDGYPRCLSNGRGKVLIHGKLAPVVGLICMDQLMVDVTDIPEAVPGDTAVLLGGGISYMEYADWCHTNRNECITILSRRPVRVYHEHGKIVTVLDSMMEERSDAE